MSFKAPLPAVLPPTPSPSSHIRRYLSSLHRHHNEHVTEGQERVVRERENGFEVFQDYKASGDSSSAGNWSEVIYRQRRDEGGGPQEMNQREGDGQGEVSRGVHAIAKVRRAAALHAAARGKVDLHGVEGKAKAREDEEDESSSETSSAERRAQRKQRRRDKKAMRHPLPSTPPPRPAKRSASTNPLGSEISVGSFVLPPVKRRKGKADGMELVRRFEASNVAVKRLTLRPGKGKSMFDRGPTSVPVRPARRARVPAEPSSRTRDQGYMDAWRRKPPATSAVQQERNDNVLVAASPEALGSPVRHTSVTPQPDLYPLPSANMINKLPPPGRTNSSPWPSEIMAGGSKGRRSGSQHSRQHSNGVLETVPQIPIPHTAPVRIHGATGTDHHQVQLSTMQPRAPVHQVSKQPVPAAPPLIRRENLPVAKSGSYGVDELKETFGQTMEIWREQSLVKYAPSTSTSNHMPVLDLSQRRSASNGTAGNPVIRLQTTLPNDTSPFRPLIIPRRTSPSVWSGPSAIRQPVHPDDIHPAHTPAAHLKIAQHQASPLIKLEPLDSPYSVIGLPNPCHSMSPSFPQDAIPRYPSVPPPSLDQLLTPSPRQQTPPGPVPRPIIIDPTDNNPFLSHGNPFLALLHPHPDYYYTQDPLTLEQDLVSSPYPSMTETDLPIIFDSRYQLLPLDERYDAHNDSRGVQGPEHETAEVESNWRNFWRDRPAAI